MTNKLDMYKDPIMEHKAMQRYETWSKKARASLPKLAERVFALRKKHYMGCGFHWSMEKRLGGVIHGLNNHDEYPGIMRRMLNKIFYSELVKDITKAERSVKELK